MIVYGKQVVFFVLNKYPHLIEKIYFPTSKKLDKKEFSLFSSLNKPIIKLDFKKAQALSQGKNHQGYFLEISNIPLLSLKSIIKKHKSNFILLIDDVQDIGNMGAILRSAYGFGVDSVIFSSIKDVDVKLPALVRASSGLALSLPLVKYFNTLDCLNELKQANFTILGANMDGIDIADIKLCPTQKRVLVLSNEHSGLNKKTKTKIDTLVKIKTKNDLESLNVSVAGAILMRELSV
jgi:23S rRNA (guanosine2251-2'-O)-methyltransferase